MTDAYVSPSVSKFDEELGVWVHTFSQTSLSNFQKCPEQARQILYHMVAKSDTTDSNAMGTASHAGAEHLLFEKRAGRALDVQEACDVALHELDEIGEWRYTKMSKATVRALVPELVTSFARNILPRVDPVAIEQRFRVPLYLGKHRHVYVAGTMDCIDAEYVPWDWKFPGHEYERWEKQRFAFQPTFYAYAVQAMHNEHHVVGEMLDAEFMYGITTTDGATQVFPVARNNGHVQWLKQVASQLAWMMEHMAEGPWPMTDAGWHCSPKWCPVFAEGRCKGAFMTDDWMQYPK